MKNIIKNIINLKNTLVLIFILGLNVGAIAQDYITIGTGTSASHSSPMNRGKKYSTHELIYLQSEIGGAYNFTKLAFHKKSGTDVNGIANVTIYMKHTSASTLANGNASLSGYTQVFSGTFTNNSTSGWMEVTLNNSFPYNGSDNLQILIVKGCQSTTSKKPLWSYTLQSNYKARGNADNGSQPTYLKKYKKRPNIRLEYGQLPDPFNGIVNIGLQAFNSVTGRNLIHQEFTRTVNQYEPVYSDNSSSKIQRESEFTNASYDESINYKTVSVQEKYYQLCENGVPHEGPLYTPLTDEQRIQYGIGDGSGVYATITAALNDLRQVGVSGPTILTLLDATYPSETFPLEVRVLNNLPTSTNTISLRPATNVDVTISGSVRNGALIDVIDVSYFTIDGTASTPGTESMTIKNTSCCLPRVINFGSLGTKEFTNVALKNCTIINGSTTASAVDVSDASVIGNPGYFSNVTIENNIIKKAYMGIYVSGGSAPNHNGSNVTITRNTLTATGNDAIRKTGIYMQGVDGATISHNEIANLNGTNREDDRGIWIASGTINATVEKNLIHSINYSGTIGYGAYGIAVTSVQANSNNIISTNVIYDISGDGYNHTHSWYKYDNPFGIMCLSDQSGVKIYYNSINLFGNTLNHNNALSAGIALFEGSTAEIINNSIVNNLGLSSSKGFGSVGVYLEENSNQLESSNYNNYYVSPSGSGQKLVGKIENNNYASLTEYKAATYKDASSLNGNPAYTSNTNLLPNGTDQNSWFLHGKGVQIPGIDTDYNGNPRHTTVPEGATDIGAYEFTPSVNPLPAAQTGTIGNNQTTTYSIGEYTLSTITWGANGTTPTSINFEYFSGTNPPSASGQYSNTYWEITPTGGSVYSYDITLYYDEAILGTIGSEQYIRIARSNDGVNWIAYLIQGTGPGQYELNTTNNTITIYGLTEFLYFTLTDENNPLPVELTSFTATVKDRNVTLNWSTAVELNNAGFEIERKSIKDGSRWTKIGFVEGNGTTNKPKNYTFTDAKLETGKYNYRLKQIDYNNLSTVFDLGNVINIGVPNKPELSQNYPNPFNPVTKIDYNLPYNGNVSLKIYDITGRQIATLVNETQTAGYYTVQFDASNFASGTYFYSITTNDGANNFVMTKRMLLIK